MSLQTPQLKSKLYLNNHKPFSNIGRPYVDGGEEVQLEITQKLFRIGSQAIKYECWVKLFQNHMSVTKTYRLLLDNRNLSMELLSSNS